jgi:hypothetical protein
VNRELLARDNRMGRLLLPMPIKPHSAPLDQCACGSEIERGHDAHNVG